MHPDDILEALLPVAVLVLVAVAVMFIAPEIGR